MELAHCAKMGTVTTPRQMNAVPHPTPPTLCIIMAGTMGVPALCAQTATMACAWTPSLALDDASVTVGMAVLCLSTASLHPRLSLHSHNCCSWFGEFCDDKCPACSHGSCDFGRDGSGLCVCETGWGGTLCNVCQAGWYGPTCAQQCGACGLHEVCDSSFDGGGCICAANWRRTAAGQPCDLCAHGYFGEWLARLSR